MTNSIPLLLGIVAIAMIRLAHADEGDGEHNEDGSLVMVCEYSDYKNFQLETVSVSKIIGRQGATEPASVKTFQRGKTQHEKVAFEVTPGTHAECIYPSGKRVRVKVGEDFVNPFGMCGADPEIYVSVWVDKRKVLSRHWFSGHCKTESDKSAFSLSVSANAVTHCQTLTAPVASNDPSLPDPSPTSPPQALAACVRFPETAHFPVDRIEYPPPGRRLPKVGSIELLRGKHPVCGEVIAALRAESNYGKFGAPVSLNRPAQTSTAVDLPPSLMGSTESVFDFNNDGALDRVFYRSFESVYMNGSAMLVQLGKSPAAVDVASAVLGSKSLFVPCQISSKRLSIVECPPFSQKGDDAAFPVEGNLDHAPTHFRARYTDVNAFRFQDETYLDLYSRSGETRNFAAVLRPLPNGRFQQMCFIRQVPPNF